MARIILISAGSDGDVLPLVSLGAAMERRGHEIALIAQVRYRRWAEERGWQFGAICPPEEYERRLRDAALMRSGHFVLFAQRYFHSWNVRILNYIGSLTTPRDTLLVSVPAGKVGADLMARVYWGIPLVWVHLTPPCPGFVQQLQRPLPAEERRRRSLVYDGLLRAVAEDLEFAPRPAAMRRFLRSAAAVRKIALWPEWFANEEANSGFEENFGFVPPPRSRGDETSRAPKPGGHIVFLAGTIGTIQEWAGPFFRTSVEACRELKRECVLIGGTREDVPDVLPSGCTWHEWAALDVALGGAAAVVHHGGIGTIGQSIRSGVPQLAVPRAFGQHSNAAWMERLGVGRVLAGSNYHQKRVVRELHRLTGSSRVRERCIQYRDRSGEFDSVEAACQILNHQIRHHS